MRAGEQRGRLGRQYGCYGCWVVGRCVQYAVCTCVWMVRPAVFVVVSAMRGGRALTSGRVDGLGGHASSCSCR